ncbi:MAG: hypothetical protein ACTSRA_20375 [Promethearchaeota archaeon]
MGACPVEALFCLTAFGRLVTGIWSSRSSFVRFIHLSLSLGPEPGAVKIARPVPTSSGGCTPLTFARNDRAAEKPTRIIFA